MLNRYARTFTTWAVTPLARLLVRARVSPDAVSVTGTLGVCAGALYHFPAGHLFVGTLVVTCFVLFDLLDGVMARLVGRPSRWGAFLDSTLDRIADTAVFAGLVLWFGGDSDLYAALTLYCLVTGVLVSYAKARAEGLAMTADVGLAERAERLILVLTGAGLSGLGVPYALETGLWVLAVASTVTLLHRVLVVRRQALAERH